jgi:hypothetical protein
MKSLLEYTPDKRFLQIFRNCILLEKGKYSYVRNVCEDREGFPPFGHRVGAAFMLPSFLPLCGHADTVSGQHEGCPYTADH